MSIIFNIREKIGGEKNVSLACKKPMWRLVIIISFWVHVTRKKNVRKLINKKFIIEFVLGTKVCVKNFISSI